MTGTTGPTGTRKYPERPILGVGAVIFVDGRVVLIKRMYEPSAGTWTLPGGVVEVGESVQAAVAREILEETGLEVEVGPVVEVVDRIVTDGEGKVAYHFVVIDYLCTAVHGTPAAGSDVGDVAMVEPERLESYAVTDAVRRVVARAARMSG